MRSLYQNRENLVVHHKRRNRIRSLPRRTRDSPMSLTLCHSERLGLARRILRLLFYLVGRILRLNLVVLLSEQSSPKSLNFVIQSACFWREESCVLISVVILSEHFSVSRRIYAFVSVSNRQCPFSVSPCLRDELGCLCSHLHPPRICASAVISRL
jgi:hypothetical protein